jgi:hypothetical protein
VVRFPAGANVAQAFGHDAAGGGRNINAKPTRGFEWNLRAKIKKQRDGKLASFGNGGCFPLSPLQISCTLFHIRDARKEPT